MYTIETKTPFSKSHIWNLQREYYDKSGIEAWSLGEVPFYITSNPIIAKTYAELVLGFLRDLSLNGSLDETVYLIEMGAGHGRLCFHFLRYFEHYYKSSRIPLPKFVYILSDFAQKNIDFWKEQEQLKYYFNEGLLDCAFFDAIQSEEIHLQRADITIHQSQLIQPLIVIGNYFFDTIPQELYWVRNQEISKCLISLESDENPEFITSANQLEDIAITYFYEDIDASQFSSNPFLYDTLETYRTSLKDSHILLPENGLACIERLRNLSQAGIMLLTADKGVHKLPYLENNDIPMLIGHGSFSLNVNYHAFKTHCTEKGGKALFPSHQKQRLNLGCLLYVDQPLTYQETIDAFNKYAADFGPEEFFLLKIGLYKHIDKLSFMDLASFLKFSNYDPDIFMEVFSRIQELLPDMNGYEKDTLVDMIPKIWNHYYFINDTHNLSQKIGDVLYMMELYSDALIFYSHTKELYGEYQSIMIRLANCYQMMGEIEITREILSELLVKDPNNEMLITMIKELN